jgi:hypothetical protein
MMRSQIQIVWFRGSSLTLCVVLLATSVVMACGRGAHVDDQQRGAHGAPVDIDDVDIKVVNSRLFVQYRTPTPIRDCEAQAEEMPRVWNLVVKVRLADPTVKNVVLFPEDPSGQSVTMAFSKNASGRWSAVAPCSITIPED